MKKKIVSSLGGACTLVASLTACAPVDQGTPAPTLVSSVMPSPVATMEPTATATPEASLSNEDGAATPVAESPISEAPSSRYIDGVYDEIGKYLSPVKDETIDVKITIKDNIITAVAVTPQSENQISLKNQTNFAAGIGDLVIGKDIDSINTFASVNGSSLSPVGFQDALEKIKRDASSKS